MIPAGMITAGQNVRQSLGGMELSASLRPAEVWREGTLGFAFWAINDHHHQPYDPRVSLRLTSPHSRSSRLLDYRFGDLARL